MKTRLGRDSERILYHGTSKDTVDKINMRGFNRSFCGKNGENLTKAKLTVAFCKLFEICIFITNHLSHKFC